MIKLNVKAYCHDCPHFDAVTNKDEIYAEGRLLMSNIEVTCRHYERCLNHMKYLKKVVQKEEDPNE